MLAVCDYDYEHNGKFLESRNRATTLVLLDTSARLSELVRMKLSDIDNEKGYIKVLGKRIPATNQARGSLKTYQRGH